MEIAPIPKEYEPTVNCICSEKHYTVVLNIVPLKCRIILIDIDNTLSDWDAMFYNTVNHQKNVIHKLNPSERVNYCMEKNYDTRFSDIDIIKNYTMLPGVFEHAPTMPGAVEAVKGMLAKGLEVFFVSKPDRYCYSRSLQEKARWLERHFGPEFKHRLIPLEDKSLIRGDILIDDNPNTINDEMVLKPVWTHVIFCRPYNMSNNGIRLHSWNEWEKLLSLCEK